MKVLAIDYSINCPAVAVVDEITKKWFVNYRKDSKSDYPDLPNMDITFTRSFDEDYITRFINLSEWVSRITYDEAPDIVIIEDYAFSANGNITALAENMGILKYTFRKTYPNLPLYLVAPTKMKKFATGKGTANKDLLWDSFVKKFPECSDWPKLIHPKGNKIGSPISDIVDAYYLAIYGVTNHAT